MRHVLVLCLLLPVLAGCMATSTEEYATPAATGAAVPPTVVGLVDTGINVYHEVFQDADARPPSNIVDAATGKQPIPIRLSSVGTAKERFAHDKATWDDLKPKTLYWFVGTRVLGYAMTKRNADPILYSDGGHGTAVASVVRNVSGGTWIVFVPDDLDFFGDPLHVVGLGGEPAAGIRWLGAQSWVDIISLSLGYPGNPPVLWNALSKATHEAADAGKVVVSGAGNTPVPDVQTGTSGPPWVISVGGAEPSVHGMASHASTAVDVVSDYARRAAASGTDGYAVYQGTSLSAPLTAGVLAESLVQVRSHVRDANRFAGVLCACDGRGITPQNLRAALNASGEYWAVDQWDPLNYSKDPVDVVLFATEPVGPAPWLQMAWGYIGDSSWRSVTAALEGQALPPKPAEAVQYMAEQQALREAYWATVPYAS